MRLNVDEIILKYCWCACFVFLNRGWKHWFLFIYLFLIPTYVWTKPDDVPFISVTVFPRRGWVKFLLAESPASSCLRCSGVHSHFLWCTLGKKWAATKPLPLFLFWRLSKVFYQQPGRKLDVLYNHRLKGPMCFSFLLKRICCASHMFGREQNKAVSLSTPVWGCCHYPGRYNRALSDITKIQLPQLCVLALTFWKVEQKN